MKYLRVKYFSLRDATFLLAKNLSIDEFNL